MVKPAPRSLRDLCIAARDGDLSACRALLRWHGKGKLAAEIRRDKPLPPRVRRMIDACTAGTGTRDCPGDWEFINEHGVIENLLQPRSKPNGQ